LFGNKKSCNLQEFRNCRQNGYPPSPAIHATAVSAATIGVAISIISNT
jgi:hypothetical protein